MSIAISADTLVVVEGDRDTSFYSQLCKSHSITGLQFQAAHGITGYPSFFLGHRTWTRFDQLKTLIVTADNDADAGKRFEDVQKALRDSGLPAPHRPLEWVKREDSPKVTIVQMPFDGTCDRCGCLETLLLEAAKSLYPDETDCAEKMFTCIGAKHWKTHSARDKFLLRSILGCVWEENPMAGVKQWVEKGLIPMDNPAFGPLVQLFSSMRNWLLSDTRGWSEWKAANL